MALSVWLPLNGTTENRGSYFDAPITTNGGCAFDNDLGFGSYLKNGIIKISSMKKIFNPRGFSVCMWIYNRQDGVSTMDNSGGIFGNPESGGTDGIRKLTLYQYETSNDFHLSWNNDDGSTCSGCIVSNAFEYQKWTHLGIVFTGDSVDIYINGNLVKQCTVNWVANDFDISLLLAQANEHHFVKDVRIYDTEISAAEVANLAKGMILHYPMNDIANTVQKNLYTLNSLRSSYVVGPVSWKYLPDENVMNYNFEYTGTNSDQWYWVRFPHVVLEVGKTYMFNVKVKCNAIENLSIYVRSALYDNDFTTANKQIAANDVGKGWIQFSYKVAMTSDTYSDDLGNHPATPCIEFCTDNMYTEGVVYKADFDVKDISIVEVESGAIQFIDGDLPEYHTTTVYDISGLENNGTLTSGKLILNQVSSPRYGTSTKFKDAKSYISIPKVLQSCHQGTLNVWVCPHDKFSKFRPIILMADAPRYKMGLLMVGLFYNDQGTSLMISFSCCGYSYNLEYETDEWYMITISYDVDAHRIKLYNNGNLVVDVTDDSINSNWLQKMSNCYIGNHAGLTNYSISDFRLYGRTLSDTDVMKLYQTPVSLSNTGVLMTQGEFIEPETSEVRKI